MALKFHTGVAKGLKLKVRKFWGASSYVCRTYMGKTGRGPFWSPILQMKPLEKSITLAVSLKVAVGNVKYIFNIDILVY